MTLIKSISGIRGTIGGKANENLTPIDIVKYAAAFGEWLKKNAENAENLKIVIGRDARISGQMLSQLVAATLQGLGFEVVDLGLATTPTVEIAVPLEKANGGIILTASHNPIQWNALKLLNAKGEFISAQDGQELLEIAEKEDFTFAEVKKIGSYTFNDTYLQKHIEMILALPLVDVEAIRSRNFKIAVDAVNSVGGFAVPALLRALGVSQIGEFNCEVTGIFAHNPEPLPEHLLQFSRDVSKGAYDLGIVVDPDVDRLAFIRENGEAFGEEYTLVAVADYVLKHQQGSTVSNLSSTQALKVITEKNGQSYFASAVGEVNVVAAMKNAKAVIGGEGNGGIIYPNLHYGRDALVGIALFLTHLAKFGKSITLLRATYPNYYISKNKIELDEGINVDEVLEKMQQKYSKFQTNTIDGLKVIFDNAWVHLRKSNTEPIIRIYAEADSISTADNLAEKVMKDIRELSK
ncbi:MAG: phosphoglucosamine mutase [Thermonemataceae bacterium]|nr:phosphoglucosamine mutase [Thermonemataceae bacterium]